jgi:hypothetical protein
MTPIAPLHELRSIIRAQPAPKAATMTTSQPLFGPCVPLRVAEPIFVQVQKTPTTAAPSAIQQTRRRCRRSRAR